MAPGADMKVGQLVGAGNPVGSITEHGFYDNSKETLKISLILHYAEKSHFYAYFSTACKYTNFTLIFTLNAAILRLYVTRYFY